MDSRGDARFSAFDGGWTRRALPRFGPNPRPTVPARSRVLDGLRGWVAFSVICYHIFWEVFGRVAPEFHNPLTGFLFDGNLAVTIFFLLSGEALSTGYFAGNGRSSVVRLAIKRYPRLTIPILATCLVTFALFKSALLFNVQAGALVDRPEWLGSWLHAPFGLVDVLKYGLALVYLTNDAGTALNVFLWTMRPELMGSLIVFAVLLTFGRWRLGWPMLAVLTLILGLATPTHSLACFPIGIALAAARSHGVFDRAMRVRPMPVVCWLVIGVVACCDGVLRYRNATPSWLAPALSVPLVLAIYCNATTSRFFESRLSQLLGRLSFPLYLMQFPVLVSVTSGGIVYAAHHGGLDRGSVWIIAILSVLACLLAAALFEPVEMLTRWVGNRLVMGAARLPMIQVARR